jgi:FkbM family methyltransferase
MDLTDTTEPEILDVGAHRGQTASTYLQLFPKAHIHSFEALPATYQRLVNEHGEDRRVECVEKAIADAVEEQTFYINHFDATNSLLPRPQEEKRYYPASAEPKAETTVQTTTIDHYTSEHNIKHVDILKLDIQGGELMALEGAEEMMASQDISLVYTEVMFAEKYKNQPFLDEVWGAMKERGYSLFNLYNLSVAPDGQLHEADAIFVSREVRSALRKCSV